MREIKFRGKRKDNAKWVYGDLVRLPKEQGNYNTPPSLEMKTYITDTGLLTKEFREVNEETIGQYTGLKDKNGKEIYEGDIVKTPTQNNVIKYEYGEFRLHGLHKDKYKRNYDRLYGYLVDSSLSNNTNSNFDGVNTTMLIIGNIHEEVKND